ncbi:MULTISPECIES: hypothetical protein [Acinetobacter calcoaceticus/baumannii complex]|uniref:hypothetical protein n=1 Tax=Acinetobacter calcoaceticus/baumannii complex TaxID=909768 RepID=UPI0015F6621E|nr:MULTISPECIES: hypothetical protein [Acinetobacter calcoaceticus/baumannii complex]MDH2587141.1 hypothetical protein [Acinetobacter baumannii]MDX8253045.1 hypothetical protein [Acinetobacter pittii]
MSNNTNNTLNIYGLGLFIICLIIFTITSKFKEVFGIDGDTALIVLIGMIVQVIGLGIFLVISRRLFETVLIAIPTCCVWLKPIFDFYAIHSQPNVPFPFTTVGQFLMFVLLCIFSFAIWYFKTYVWKEIWE